MCVYACVCADYIFIFIKYLITFPQAPSYSHSYSPNFILYSHIFSPFTLFHLPSLFSSPCLPSLPLKKGFHQDGRIEGSWLILPHTSNYAAVLRQMCRCESFGLQFLWNPTRAEDAWGSILGDSSGKLTDYSPRFKPQKSFSSLSSNLQSQIRLILVITVYCTTC